MSTKVKKICLKLKIIIMSSNTIFILWMMKWGERDCTLLQILVCVSACAICKWVQCALASPGIIDRLEKKGLVARLPKKEDKRTTYIALTSLGAKLLEKIPALLHERLSVKLEKLPKEKINELDDALNVLTHYLDISEVDASPNDYHWR